MKHLPKAFHTHDGCNLKQLISVSMFTFAHLRVDAAPFWSKLHMCLSWVRYLCICTCVSVASPWLPHATYFPQFISVNGHSTFRKFLGVYRWTDPLILRSNHRSTWRRIRHVDADPRCWFGEQCARTQSSQQLENSRSVNAHYTYNCQVCNFM